jgi:hypothetical protein
MGVQWKDGYSAHVEIQLRLGDERLGVAQLCPDFFILREFKEIAPQTPAVILLKIDDEEEERPVLVHRGTVPGVRRVEYISG